MPYIRTRGEIRERLTAEIQRQANTGTYSDGYVNRRLQEGLARAWYRCLKWGDFGRSFREFTIAVASDTLDIPDEVFAIHGIERPSASDPGQLPDRVTRDYAIQIGLFNAATKTGGYYLIEGPGQEWDGANYVPFPQRIRFWPQLAVGEIVRLHHASNPPSLGDPDVGGDDAVTVDVIAEPFERVVVFEAAAVVIRREDQAQQARITQARVEAEADFRDLYGRRDQAGVHYLEDHRRVRGYRR